MCLPDPRKKASQDGSFKGLEIIEWLIACPFVQTVPVSGELAWRLNGAYHPTQLAIQTPDVNAYVNKRCLTVRERAVYIKGRQDNV